MSAKLAEATALFRYRVIAEAISPRLSPAERGSIVRALARHLHEHPDGSQRQYSRGTLDRWLRAYREQGLAGLKPDPRADLGAVRRYPELLDEACALRSELPTRSAAQIGAILFARHRIRVAERTIREHLQRRGLHRAALAGQPRAFGRFEASRPNELWIGDVLVGPFVPYPRTSGSKARLPLRPGRRLLTLAAAWPLGARPEHARRSGRAARRHPASRVTRAPVCG